MQEVSNNWKNAHKKTILNESFVEVSLDIADPEAVSDTTPTQDNGSVYISNTSNLRDGVDKAPTPYCTLEQNLWCLDGNRKAIPESDFGDNCYVGDALSDDTCIFSTKMPVITIGFGKVFDKLIPGVTITWSPTYNEWADTFVVIAYNGNTVVAEKEVVGNKSVKSLILTDISHYDRIEIIVKKWCLPNHRARVEEIFVGLHKVYGKTDLFDYSHSQSVDPVSLSLPKFEIRFSIDNVSGEYNPHNARGLDKYLMERQEIKSRYGLKMDDGSVEWINGGTFYLSEWYAKQNGMTADFTARDLLEFMSATYHDNDYVERYDEITHPDSKGRTLCSLAEAVLKSADLPKNGKGEDKWVIDGIPDAIYTKAPLPEDTIANCLQLIANAAECVLYQDREGTLRIEPLKGSDTDTSQDTDYKIDSSNSYSKSEITLSKPIKQVNVKVYTYTLGEKGIESSTIEVSNAGEAVMGETITVDNPLITDTDRANSLASWLVKHLGHRMTLDSSWRADVRLDALDIVRNENNYNTNRVRMTDVEFKYNGAFRGTGKGKVI